MLVSLAGLCKKCLPEEFVYGVYFHRSLRLILQFHYHATGQVNRGGGCSDRQCSGARIITSPDNHTDFVCMRQSARTSCKYVKSFPCHLKPYQRRVTLSLQPVFCLG